MSGRAGSPLVVGVDGGATRTRLAVADRGGGILARSHGGPSLLGAGADAAVADSLVRQVNDLVSGAGGTLPVEAICAGLAGAGSDAARAALADRMRELGVARRARVVTDAEVAFIDAFGDGVGILLIAGTGSVALARAAEGAALRRVGGWGALLGDEGSGYRIGLEGLQAAIRAAEARGPETALTRSLFQETGVGSLEELLAWSRRTGKSGIAALAPGVAGVADEGDAVAERVVGHAAESLVAHVRTLAEEIGRSPPPPVALVGGLVEKGGSLRDRLVRELERAGFHSLRRSVDPVRGAVRAALGL